MEQGKVVAIVQARTGSSRLPGKVVYPLAGRPVLTRILQRARHASQLDEIVVATTGAAPDRVVVQLAAREGVATHTGSEEDVLDRVHEAAHKRDADTVVRICGDSPFLSAEILDATVERLQKTGADYASNKIRRTFPVGLDVEAFTSSSFDDVHDRATEPSHREHVTVHYRQHPDRYEIANLDARSVFSEPRYVDRTDLRLTLDTAEDYELAFRVWEELGPDPSFGVREVIDIVDTRGLDSINENVRQRTVA